MCRSEWRGEERRGDRNESALPHAIGGLRRFLRMTVLTVQEGKGRFRRRGIATRRPGENVWQRKPPRWTGFGKRFPGVAQVVVHAREDGPGSILIEGAGGRSPRSGLLTAVAPIEVAPLTVAVPLAGPIIGKIALLRTVRPPSKDLRLLWGTTMNLSSPWNTIRETRQLIQGPLMCPCQSRWRALLVTS